ncbi:MAG: UDP-N-acetylmuramoyl-tripeptide--D-alanyl-D-alanine ligase [Desulfobacterales bacterium]|jgi:UDP-N-acetylmuramoyl-tripeptide--D-alanyl-D-alanine ligase|nr:UDP-N-acetylmuramoyl-tripeptide--D-alanyl-D-alanine ligase [Desulfobacterales bacterium]
MLWTLTDILQATGGELLWGEPRQGAGGVSIDSRTLCAGELFVAIRGEVHDGHRFIPAALARGASGLLVDRRGREALPAEARRPDRVFCVAVADTTRALGDLAAFHRGRLPAAAVAITGSNGKTSTRRMTAAVLSRRFATLEADRNLNNQIGVPLTLLRLTAEHRWAVLELGTNQPGEIARLAEICAPAIGVITNIGPAHLEGLGSLEGVLAEKSSLLRGLRPGGRAVLNADDPRLRGLLADLGSAALGFGVSSDASVRAVGAVETAAGIDFELVLPDAAAAVHLEAHGRFMVQNALAAAAVGSLLGLPAAEIAEGLRRFAPVAGRMQVSELAGGIRLIDDTYNANPASMRAALDALTSLRGAARGIMVAADMRELGAEAAALHRDLGRMAAARGTAKLFVCGDFSAEVAAGAEAAGMPAADILTGSRGEIQAALLAELKPGDWVLVKGSRATAMDHVARAIRQWAEDPARTSQPHAARR